MYSKPCLLLLAVLLSALAYFKLRRTDDTSKFHDFDVNATLPLRGILAVLIVCHHISQRFIPDPIGIFLHFGTSVVSVFFFISGYGLMISYQKKGKEYLSNFFRHRLSKLLPAFLTLTVACCMYYCLFKHHQINEIFKELLLHGNPPLQNSWFIYAIIYQYISFYIACKTSHTTIGCIVIASILTLAAMIGTRLMHFGDWWYLSLPSFILGMIIESYEDTFRKILSKYTFITFAIITFIISLGVANCRLHITTEGIANFSFCNLMPLLVICIIYAYGSIKNKCVKYLGDISLEIYLIHGSVILFAGHFNLPWYAFLVCVFFITIPAADITHRYSKMISSHF
jgi:peptidoglycan/LPS O-acetylase OafA/YrhL